MTSFKRIAAVAALALATAALPTPAAAQIDGNLFLQGTFDGVFTDYFSGQNTSFNGQRMSFTGEFDSKLAEDVFGERWQPLASLNWNYGGSSVAMGNTLMFFTNPQDSLAGISAYGGTRGLVTFELDGKNTYFSNGANGAFEVWNFNTFQFRSLTITGGQDISYRVTAVPEPATWAMMIAGFAVVGGAMRRRRTAVTARVRLAA